VNQNYSPKSNDARSAEPVRIDRDVCLKGSSWKMSKVVKQIKFQRNTKTLISKTDGQS
jgi:hypothetical protein